MIIPPKKRISPTKIETKTNFGFLMKLKIAWIRSELFRFLTIRERYQGHE